MLIVVGAIVVTFSVIIGYVLSHGQLMALWQPFELIIIGGAAFGGYLAANPMPVHKAVARNLLAVLKGSKYKQQQYLELLSVIFELLQTARKKGMLALESHIEEPHSSEIFNKSPVLQNDHGVLEFICDYLRLMIDGALNPLQLQELMVLELETHHQESELPHSAVTKVADGLPGFGIVAAVLGIVITMASLGDGDTVAIGKHVAAALVGTFLGILLAYGYVAPIADAMAHAARDESKFLECAKVCLLSTAQGYPPKIAVEFGRKVIFHKDRPSFEALNDSLDSKPAVAAAGEPPMEQDKAA